MVASDWVQFSSWPDRVLFQRSRVLSAGMFSYRANCSPKLGHQCARLVRKILEAVVGRVSDNISGFDGQPRFNNTWRFFALLGSIQL
jgi:hypothetical protein